MRKHRKDEQEFLENIDRLIAGEEVGISDDADEDLRATIEFSRRLSDIHSGPSPEFKNGLKARLLMKLTEQDVAARQKTENNRLWDILGNLIPQSPVWRTATVTVVMVIAVVSVLWRTGMFTGTQLVEQQMLKGRAQTAVVMEAGTEEASVSESPRMALSADDSAPAPVIMDAMATIIDLQVIPSGPTVAEYGSEITYQLTFTNVTGDTVTITQFPPGITIVGDGVLRPVRIIPEGDQTIEVGPSGSIAHVLSWNQLDDSGAQVAPGWYTILTGAIAVTGTEDTTWQGPWEFRINLQD